MFEVMKMQAYFKNKSSIAFYKQWLTNRTWVHIKNKFCNVCLLDWWRALSCELFLSFFVLAWRWFYFLSVLHTAKRVLRYCWEFISYKAATLSKYYHYLSITLRGMWFSSDFHISTLLHCYNTGYMSRKQSSSMMKQSSSMMTLSCRNLHHNWFYVTLLKYDVLRKSI